MKDAVHSLDTIRKWVREPYMRQKVDSMLGGVDHALTVECNGFFDADLVFVLEVRPTGDQKGWQTFTEIIKAEELVSPDKARFAQELSRALRVVLHKARQRVGVGVQLMDPDELANYWVEFCR
jgi:hypothetical protein